MQTQKVLIVWSEIPENIKFYLLDLDSRQTELALNAHDTFININGNLATNWLSEFLEDKSAIIGPIRLSGDTLVISSGFAI